MADTLQRTPPSKPPHQQTPSSVEQSPQEVFERSPARTANRTSGAIGAGGEVDAVTVDRSQVVAVDRTQGVTDERTLKKPKRRNSRRHTLPSAIDTQVRHPITLSIYCSSYFSLKIYRRDM